MEILEEETTDWKEKYEECSARQTELETLSKDVLKEYTELKKKYAESHQQNEAFQKKISENAEEINQMKNLIQPAITEYDTLRNKYEIEKGCRYEAQKYATQVVHQNIKLKRQSMDLLGVLNKSNVDITTLEINFEDDEEPDSEENSQENGLTKTLNAKIKELRNEAAAMKTELSQVHQDLHIEKENYKWAQARYQAVKTQLTQTEKALKQHKEALKELSKVSEAAYEEYETLKQTYELETKRRSFAEKKVSEFAVQNNKMKRQSDALLCKLNPGDQLHRAMVEIDDLTQKLEDQRKYYDAQIEELSSKVESYDEAAVDNLQSEKQSLHAEKDSLEARLTEYEEKYNKLEAQYAEVQQKLEEALKPPAPPPPPPPPQIQQSKGFLARITGSKKKKVDKNVIIAKGGANMNAEFSKALDEMLDNIKRGKSLRPALKPVKKAEDQSGNAEFKFMLKSRSVDNIEKSLKGSVDGGSEGGSAMAELQSIMSKMKRTQSDSDLLSPVETEKGESEFAQAFRKIKKTTSADSVPTVTRREKLAYVAEERESEALPARKDAGQTT